MTAAMAASLAACGNSTANTSSTTDAAASDAAQTSDAAPLKVVQAPLPMAKNIRSVSASS